MAFAAIAVTTPLAPRVRARSAVPVQFLRQPTTASPKRSFALAHSVQVADPSTIMSPSDAPPPAVLEGTPTSFPIPAEKLIAMAKHVFIDTQTGIHDDSVLSDDFRFEFPIVSLPRSAYLKTVRAFGLRDAFPVMDSRPYDWRVDPYEPNRVWFTTRSTAVHSGALKFGGKAYPATGKTVMSPPECCSYTFNEDGKVTSFTGGVVMDRRVGNTGGMGALFGILYAIGAPVPKPGTLAFTLAVTLNKFVNWLKGIFSFGRKNE